MPEVVDSIKATPLSFTVVAIRAFGLFAPGSKKIFREPLEYLVDLVGGISLLSQIWDNGWESPRFHGLAQAQNIVVKCVEV